MGTVLRWIEAFLTGRRQGVVMNGSKWTTWTNVAGGISQGSVLGRLLYVSFIDDMPNVVTSPVHAHYLGMIKVVYRRVTTIENHQSLVIQIYPPSKIGQKNGNWVSTETTDR